MASKTKLWVLLCKSWSSSLWLELVWFGCVQCWNYSYLKLIFCEQFVYFHLSDLDTKKVPLNSMFELIRAVFRFHENFASIKTQTCLRLARQLQECDISCENWDNLRRHNNQKHKCSHAKSNTTKYVESAYSHLKNIFDGITFRKQPQIACVFPPKACEQKKKNFCWGAASCLGSKHDLVLSSFSFFLRHLLQDNLTSSHPRLWLSRWFATKEKISSDEKWRSCTDHVLPGQVYMGPGQKRTQPVRTGSNVDFLCGLKLFLLDPCLLHKSPPLSLLNWPPARLLLAALTTTWETKWAWKVSIN